MLTIGWFKSKEAVVLFLKNTFYGNTLGNYLLAIGILVGGTLLLKIFMRILARSLKKLNEKYPGETTRMAGETVERTKSVLLLFICAYIGSRVLTLPAAAEKAMRYMVIIAVGIQIGIWASALARKLVSLYISRQDNAQEYASARTMVNLGVRVLIWSAVLLMVLDNMGFTITTLVAGLGVGGIAVAMASQQILADLFASLSIILDKPFRLGDFIIVGDLLGTVENIGLKTTRIRSLSGEEVVLANNDLLSSRIKNYATMQERRVVFTIGVEYNTAYDKLKSIPDWIKEVIESIEKTRFDRSHFSQYGNFSLNIETVYYVLSPDYLVYMDIQQAINLQIFKKFEQESVVFAFPTQTIHLHGKTESPQEGRMDRDIRRTVAFTTSN